MSDSNPSPDATQSALTAPAKRPLARPIHRPGAPAWLRGLARLPGDLADLLTFAEPQPPTSDLSLAEVEARVRRSPRANGYLALEPELSLLREGDALLAYRVHGRTAFGVGGLHAPSRAAAGGLAALRHRLAKAGFRRVLVFPVAEDERKAFHDAGFRTRQVGAEAFLNPLDFDLGVPERADVRHMRNRAAKRGGLRTRELDPTGDRDAIERVYAQWCHHFPSGKSMRLLVGTPALDRPFRRRYFGAFDPESDRLVAFLTITPGWNESGWGVDVMARSPDAPPGTMDLLFVRTLARLETEGVERFSLGPSPLVEPPGSPPAGWLLPRVFRVLYRSRLGNRFFPFQGLAFFKNKFVPVWVPISIAGWPRIGVWSLYEGCRMWGLFE